MSKKGAGGTAERTLQTVGLKELAGHVGLSMTTLSLVLNEAPAAEAIPAETKNRILKAARELNYGPNFVARSLRSKRTYTLGVLVPELSDGYSALVFSGVEECLLQEGYFYFVASHRHKTDLIDNYPRLLFDRCVEGLIAVDTPFDQELGIPVVSVSGIQDRPGVTNIILNHETAVELALRHLIDLGHQSLAVIKGQVFSSDTEIRWEAIVRAAARLGVTVGPDRVAQLEGDLPSPELGYVAAQKLLQEGAPFTALFAFNDVSAIGAIRAFHDAGKRVPEDISVIGFDDVCGAAFHNPALTTVRQPLRRMGRLAAETLLSRIARDSDERYPKLLTIDPELVVRESTCRVPE